MCVNCLHSLINPDLLLLTLNANKWPLLGGQEGVVTIE